MPGRRASRCCWGWGRGAVRGQWGGSAGRRAAAGGGGDVPARKAHTQSVYGGNVALTDQGHRAGSAHRRQAGESPAAVEAVRRQRRVGSYIRPWRVVRLETQRGAVCCQLGSPRIGHRVSRGYSRPPSVVTHRPSPVSPPDTASSAGSFTGTPCHNGLPEMDTTYMVTNRHPLKY